MEELELNVIGAAREYVEARKNGNTTDQVNAWQGLTDAVEELDAAIAADPEYA